MTQPKAELKNIPIEQIVPGKYQPRRRFTQAELEELALSIQSQGLIQPVVVRPVNSQQYELIAGERRWRASQLAKLDVIPCLVRDYTDEQAAASSLIENVNRQDLNPIEEALGYKRLLEEFHYTQEELATIIGISRVAITHKLRLLQLDKQIQQWVEEKQLSEGHAKVMVSLTPRLQLELAEACIKQGWSVRKLEQELKKRSQNAPSQSAKSADVKKLEQMITDQLGSDAQIEIDTHKGGWLRIRYINHEILEGILDKIGVKYDE